MQDNHRFYLCRRDGTLVGLIHGGGGELTCCGEPMEELTAGSTDAAQEKHVPQVKVDGCDVTVEVGSVHHPMSEEHLSLIHILYPRGAGGQPPDSLLGQYSDGGHAGLHRPAAQRVPWRTLLRDGVPHPQHGGRLNLAADPGHHPIRRRGAASAGRRGHRGHRRGEKAAADAAGAGTAGSAHRPVPCLLYTSRCV